MKTLAYISGITILLPVVMGLMRMKSAGAHLKIIVFYFLLCLVTEAISLYLGYHKRNNNLVADLFYIIEGLVLISFFYLLFKEAEFKIPAIIIAIVYVVYGCYTTFYDPGFKVYNSGFRAGESLLIQALSAYALIKISKEEDLRLMQHPEFWISAAFFIYFSVNIVVFFTATFLFENNMALMRKTWVIHSIVNIGANIIFTFGLSCIQASQRR